MKNALRAALATPMVLAPFAAVMGGLILIVIVVVLGFRSLRMDDIRAELRKAAGERERIEKHLEYIDGQNARSVRRADAHDQEIDGLAKDVKAAKDVVAP